MNNQCPKCGQEAMTATQKLMVRPHVCQNCGSEVRMNIVYTVLLSLVYFGLAVHSLVTTGFSGGGWLRVIVLTVVFMGICLFIPFEEKPVKQ